MRTACHAASRFFILLYFTFGSFPQALLVVGNIPFALVGGVAALWLRGMNLNFSASIGFIALFGVAMLSVTPSNLVIST